MQNDQTNPYQPIEPEEWRQAMTPQPRPGLTAFEKLCAVLAFALGIGFLLLGVIGLFTGCRANFSLPPVLGVLPAFIGWGIIRPIIKSWN